MAHRPPLAPAAPWAGRRVVLGVTGGIAAYKSVQLARDLTLLGAVVDVVMTESAGEFVRPLTFQAVTGRPVYSSLWSVEGAARHLQLARDADLVLVAPATADLLARAAQGRADDLLTAILLATRAPVLLAPAMNDRMWSHPQTRANTAHCRDTLGYLLAGPGEGALAAGEGEGPGRMLEPRELVEHAGRALGARAPWVGRTVLVTAGPTREPLDPVRFVGNRSSGRMGFALARAAWLRGARVVLVSGPVALDDPVGVETVRVETAVEMHEVVEGLAPTADVAIFAAAVADFRPETAGGRKVKRAEAGSGWEVRLVENPDVAGGTRELRKPGAVAVGFALETDDLEAHAAEKLRAKGFDLVVANAVGEPGAGFEVETNRVTLITRQGAPEPLPLMTKVRVAAEVLDRVEGMLGSEPAHAAHAPAGAGG